MANNMQSLYAYVLQQMVAESYLEGITDYTSALVRQRLGAGNARNGFSSIALTRFTPDQSDDFLGRFAIKHQWSDNATSSSTGAVTRPMSPGDIGFIARNGEQILANSGLSATLIQEKGTDNYTLSIRSTEYLNWKEGGDFERDGNGADFALLKNGFALAQLDSLDRYYEWLRSTDSGALPLLPTNAVLSVSGFSLGGHLATVFTELRSAAVAKTYTFNAPGRGKWNQSSGSLSDMLAYYRAVLANPEAAGSAPPEGDSNRAIYLSAVNARGSLDARRSYDRKLCMT